MTTLVTIGCSHTAGSMIDGRCGTSWYNKEHSYGGVLAKKLGMTHYNLGVPGGSNQYIYRATIRFINNFMHPQDDYIFLLGWTSTLRMELRYPEKSPYIHKVIGDFLDNKYVPFTVGTDPGLYETKDLVELDKMAPLLFYEDLLATDWAVYAYTLQHIFNQKNLRYYMFNSCFELPRISDNSKIVDALDRAYYHKPTDKNSSMLYWGLRNGYEKTSCWHLKQDGHQAWANHLEELMSNVGLFDNITQRKIKNSTGTISVAGKKISKADVKSIISKYKVEAEVYLDSMYDKIYLLYSRDDTEHTMKIKTNLINRDLNKRFGPTAKIDKFYNEHQEMDETWVIDYFRKQIYT